MSESASISTGIASRYATAVFELSKEGGGIGPLEADVDTLTGILADSADFRDLIHSPVYSREDQGAAVSAIADWHWDNAFAVGSSADSICFE